MIGDSRLRRFWERYKRNGAAVLGLILVLFFASLAIFAPLLSPHDPLRIGEETFVPPGTDFLMGTDDLGRDVLSGVLYGARISLLIGLLAATVSTVIGILVGAIAGYRGGRIDDLLMRVSELFQVIPRFFLAVVMVIIFGPNIWNIIFVIGILSWPTTARLVRADFLSLKEREFVMAARALGISDKRIIFREILPNAIIPVIVNASLQVASAILIEAGLSFLGLGDPRLISWGRMLYNAQGFLRQAWWMSVFPGLAIFFTVLGINLVGDGLNDALNPRLRKR